MKQEPQRKLHCAIYPSTPFFFSSIIDRRGCYIAENFLYLPKVYDRSNEMLAMVRESKWYRHTNVDEEMLKRMVLIMEQRVENQIQRFTVLD